MAASKEENERYRRSVRNPWYGASPGAIAKTFANPRNDPRVLVDVPAQAERAKTVMSAIFDMQKRARELAGVNMAVDPIGNAMNVFGPALDDPRIAQAAGFKLDMPAVRAAGYRTPNFGGAGGGGMAPPSAATFAPADGSGVAAPSLDAFRAAIVQQESRGNYGAKNPSTGALGAYQVMPETGRVLAGRLGLPWRPDLMTSNSAEGRQYQDAVGSAAVKEAYDYGGGDMSKAAMYYHGGSNQKIWGPKTRQYAMEVGQRLGGGAIDGLMNPFDSAQPYINQAIGSVRQATQQAMQPQTFDVALPDAPTAPDAPVLPKRDFSETDRMLETLRPVFMDDIRQKRIVQGQMWQGLAQGLAATPENAHWGKVLANLGAGMLQGKMAGEQELQRRYDAFEEKMYAYEQMAFRYESGKSDALYQSALQDAQTIYQHNWNKFQTEMTQFNKMNGVDMGADGSVIVRQQKPGGMTVSVRPNVPAILARGSMAEAGIWEGAGRMAQQGAGVVAGVQNQLVGAAMLDEWQRSRSQGAFGAEADSAAGSAGIWSAELVRTGAAADVFPDWAEKVKQVRLEATAQGLVEGNEAHQEFVNQRLQGMVTTMLMADPGTRERVGKLIPGLLEDRRARQMEERRRTTTRDSRGRVTDRLESPF